MELLCGITKDAISPFHSDVPEICREAPNDFRVKNNFTIKINTPKNKNKHGSTGSQPDKTGQRVIKVCMFS